MKWSVKKTWPGGPELGTTLNEKQVKEFQPEKNNEYFKVVPGNLSEFITEDGVAIYKNNTFYVLRGQKVTPHVFLGYEINELTYSTIEAAEKALYSQIFFPTEDGDIIGEKVLVYRVCTGNEWRIETQDSLSMSNAYKKGNLSSRWKNFKTKESRDEYIFKNKPNYTAEDVVKLVLEYNPDADKSLIYQHLKKIKLCHDQ